MTDRAISEALGFVFVFGIVITSVGIVGFAVTDQLDAFQQSQTTDNAERALVLLNSNVDEVVDGRASVRSGEINLDSGRLQTIPDSESRIRVNVTDTSGPAKTYNETLAMSGLRYRHGDTSIGLEGGAVFRAGREGDAVMQAAPEFVCEDDRAFLTVVTIDGENRQVAGGTVGVTVERNVTSIEFPTNRTGVNSTQGRANLSVDIVDSPYRSGWEQYFKDHGDWRQDGDTFVCAGPSGNGVALFEVVRVRVNASFTR